VSHTIVAIYIPIANITRPPIYNIEWNRQV